MIWLYGWLLFVWWHSSNMIIVNSPRDLITFSFSAFSRICGVRTTMSWCSMMNDRGNLFTPPPLCPITESSQRFLSNSLFCCSTKATAGTTKAIFVGFLKPWRFLSKSWFYRTNIKQLIMQWNCKIIQILAYKFLFRKDIRSIKSNSNIPMNRKLPGGD